MIAVAESSILRSTATISSVNFLSSKVNATHVKTSGVPNYSFIGPKSKNAGRHRKDNVGFSKGTFSWNIQGASLVALL